MTDRREMSEDEVDRREREQDVVFRTATGRAARERGSLVGPGVRPPVELGVDALGRDPLDDKDPHAVPPARWRSEILASGALNVLLGAWLIASPVVLGYDAGDPAWHDAAVGLPIAAVVEPGLLLAALLALVVLVGCVVAAIAATLAVNIAVRSAARRFGLRHRDLFTFHA